MDVVDRIYQIGEKPDQGQIQYMGNQYLDSQFPQLTYIKSNPKVVAAEKKDLWTTRDLERQHVIHVPSVLTVAEHIWYAHSHTSCKLSTRTKSCAVEKWDVQVVGM